jgi:hypothetical protein
MDRLAAPTWSADIMHLCNPTFRGSMSVCVCVPCALCLVPVPVLVLVLVSVYVCAYVHMCLVVLLHHPYLVGKSV